jgi:AcrR family transcriptional regulator
MPDPVTIQLARGSILAAAMKVFSQHGIAATRVEDLLQAAGMSRRTFYKYFRSKEDVLAALHEVLTAELVKAIERAGAGPVGEPGGGKGTGSRADGSAESELVITAGEPGAPLAGIHRGIDIYLDYHHQWPRALREVLEHAMRSDSLLAARRRWMNDELVRILDQAVRRLDGRRLDPLVFRALLGALEGLSLHLLDGRGGEVERGRAVLHALVDQTLGVPDPRPLPRVSSAR